MTTQFYFDKEQFQKFHQAWCESINDGYQMTASHFMLYNILRGKHPQHGFTPFKRPSKFYGMGLLNRGVYEAWQALNQIHHWTTEREYWHDRVHEFLEPFNGTMTFDEFKGLEIPKIEPIWTNYGKGKAIATRIESGEIKVDTCEELQELYDTDFVMVRGIRVDKENAA